MHTILSLIEEYRIFLGALVVLLATIVALNKWWATVSLWWLSVTCSVPWVGKNARYAKRVGLDDKSKWFTGEKNICEAFAPHYVKYSKNEGFFDNCRSYLRKATETGRNSLPTLGWVGLACMVFLEALGFSYVLAGWTIPGASEQLKQQGAVGIAFLISGLLVIGTHFTGHQLHHNSLIKKVNQWWQMDKGQGHKQPNTQVDLANDPIDDGDEQWRQLLSRVPDPSGKVTPSYVITAATLIMIVLVGIGATYVRGQVLEQQMAAQQELSNAGGASNSQSSDPYAQNAPTELENAQRKVDNNVHAAVDGAERRGGWVTFIILAVLFVFLQFIGIVIGFKTGFAGKESKAARKFINGFNTRDEFATYYQNKRERVVRLADRHLGQVQSRMAAQPNLNAEKRAHLDTAGHRHFSAFLREREARELVSPAAMAADGATPAVAASPEPLSAVANAAADRGEVLDEAEIREWMQKLGWDRERTIERLTQAKQKKQDSARAARPLSDEEADRLLEEQLGQS